MELIRSPETDAIFRELRKLGPGQAITFGALSAAVGFDVGQYKRKVDYVRRNLETSGEAVILRQGSELYRVTDEEIVTRYPEKAKRRIRNASTKAAGGLSSVDYDKLSLAHKTAHNAHLSAFGAIKLFTKETTHKKISAGVEKANATLPTREMLKLFE